MAAAWGWRRSGADQSGSDVTPDRQRNPEQSAPVVRKLAQQMSSLGKDAAEVRGVLEDTQKVVQSQAQAMLALSRDLDQVHHAQQAIGQSTDQSQSAVARARQSLEKVGAEVGGIIQTLRLVSDAASEITQIALQTRLVAFNASVEAKRAGEAGRGFGVVADAVKDLAAKVEQSSKSIMGTVTTLDGRVESFSRELLSQSETAGSAGSSAKSSIHQSFAEVESDVRAIGQAAGASQQTVQALAGRTAELEQEVKQAMQNLQIAFACSDRFLQTSEEMIQQIADSGVEVEDALYIRAAQQAAADIGRLLKEALQQKQITEQQLFDERYVPIEGTAPAQFLTQYVGLADRLFPAVQERLLSLSDKVVYCIAVDRNGYVATHNKKYCHPQRAGDVVWNTANSRYRRIFNDRTGLASARNQRPFLLQTYRRDMGGGSYVLLKEASAPITVNGRHWGGLRLAFGF